MRKLLLCIFPLILLLAGCSSVSTRRGFLVPITEQLETGNPDKASVMLEQAREKNKYAEKDRFLYFVDAGMLNHYARHYDTSNVKFHLADAAAEELFTKSISRAAASLVLNDNVLEYAGEDYEILYANLVSSLNYIALNQFDDAFVEIRRANDKLNVLESKYADAAAKLQEGNPDDSDRVQIEYEVPKVRFYNDAFGRYLSMHMYAADGKMDDARIDFDYLVDAFESQPNIYDFPMPDVTYASEEGSVLSVVALVGLSPLKQALSLRIRTDKDLDLVQVLYDGPDKEDVEYGHFPVPVNVDYYFKFAIPVMEARPSQVASIRLIADGETVGQLQLLEDVTKVAVETFRAKKALIYIRSVARAVAKGLATHKLKKKADTGGLAGWLKKAAIDVGSDISENADLRSCQFLPGRVFVGDFSIAPGTYDLTVQFLDVEGRLIKQTNYADYVVLESGLNLIQAHSVD